MKRKDIHLHIPRSWNECSTEQLEQLSALAIRRSMAEQMGMPADTSDREYKLHAFLTLAGLKDECHTEWMDGDAVYWFPLKRSTWWKRWFGRRIMVPVRAWEMVQWVDKHLKWLDDPYQRLRAPYVDVNVRRILPIVKCKLPFTSQTHLRCLTDRMTDCTYKQYISMENILKQYWVVQQLAQDMAKKQSSTDALLHQLDNLEQLRRMFMATILSPSTHIVQEEHNGTMVSCNKVTFAFDEAQIEQYKDRFTRRQVDRMFPVLLQFYLSTQKYFSSLYPELYVHREDEGSRMQMPDFIRLEIESMSTIMKYQGFSDYKAIYDSDAVHILRVLDNMARESREMKQMKVKN